MHTRLFVAWSFLLSALSVAVVTGRAFGQSATDAATRQYDAAADLQNRSQFDAAAKEWAKFIDTYRTDARGDRAFHYLGVCYLKTGKLDLARQCFEIVVKTFPKCELIDATYYCLGSTLYQLGRAGKPDMYAAAADAFETVIEKYPDSQYVVEALFTRGEAFYHEDRKAQAAVMYEQLLAKFPEDKLATSAQYALGVSREELGQYEEAGRSYDLFLKRYPHDTLAAEVTVRRGETLLAQGQFELAAERFAAAAGMPDFALADHATVRQAEALVRLKRYTEAAALYDSVPVKWPKSKLSSVAALAGGKCYYLVGNFAEARKTLETAASAAGDSAGDAAHWLIRSILKQGQPSEAAAVAEKLLAKFSDSPQAAQLMLDRADAVYDIPERREESIGLYGALAAKYPKADVAPRALYLAGFAALGRRNYPAALEHSAAFLAVYPKHDLAADAMYVAAESLLQSGQHTEADERFSSLVETYPDHADAEAWKTRRVLLQYLQKRYAETIGLADTLISGDLHSPEAVAEAQYLAGASHAELKAWPAAVNALEASLAAQPNWRQADDTLLLLAQAYGELHDSDKAKRALARLIADFPQSRTLDRAHFRLGELNYGTGDFAAAATEYQTVIDRWPQSPLAAQAFYGLGWARLNQNDYAAAEKCFDAMLSRDIGDSPMFPDTKIGTVPKLMPRARYARAIARHQLKNYVAAIEDIHALLAADPTRAEKSDAYYLLGLCQTGLQKPDVAADTFRAILRDDPGYGAADRVLYELAWSLKQQGKEKESIDVFARLASERPESTLAAEGQYRVAEFAYKSGDCRRAATAYRAAVAKAGKTELGEKASHKLGWAYFRLDDFANAQRAFSQQRAAWPTGPLCSDGAFMEGESLLAQRQFADALSAYEAVKAPCGKDFEVLALLHAGQAAAELKQWDRSLRLLTACIDRFPASVCWPEALCEQAWVMQNLGKRDEALALYRQVIAKTDREVAARAQFMIGELQFEEKNYREATKSFFKVAYGYSYPKWQAEATYEAARCFDSWGKTDEAIRQYQDLIAKFPESAKTDLARQRIEVLKQ